MLVLKIRNFLKFKFELSTVLVRSMYFLIPSGCAIGKWIYANYTLFWCARQYHIKPQGHSYSTVTLVLDDFQIDSEMWKLLWFYCGWNIYGDYD